MLRDRYLAELKTVIFLCRGIFPGRGQRTAPQCFALLDARSPVEDLLSLLRLGDNPLSVALRIVEGILSLLLTEHHVQGIARI